MKRNLVTKLTFALGVFFTLLALSGSLVTMASGDYRAVLLDSIGFAGLAVAAYAVTIKLGSLAWRIATAIVALPLSFVLYEFVRRAPYTFNLLR